MFHTLRAKIHAWKQTRKERAKIRNNRHRLASYIVDHVRTVTYGRPIYLPLIETTHSNQKQDTPGCGNPIAIAKAAQSAFRKAAPPLPYIKKQLPAIKQDAAA
jgi:hypothetical protein